MPKFSQSSFSKLSTCEMELQVLFFEVIRSYDCIVLEGFRNQEDQEKAFESGTTTLHWPHGKHNSNPSTAIDVAPYPLDWKNLKRFYHFSGFVLGIAEQLKAQGKMTRSIRCGADWDGDKDLDDQKFNDLVHYELI